MSEMSLLAGEYVLGTLTFEEREAFARRLETDESVREAVRDWEETFGPLIEALPEIAPPASVWTAIEKRIGSSAAIVPFDPVSHLRRSVTMWQRVAGLGSALAAALLVFIIGEHVLQERPGETYIAAINRGGDQPALIVRVEMKTGRIHVRPVSAESPADRSLELWYIGKGQAPKSLGLVERAALTKNLPPFENLSATTLAVTLEPKGGSPTGDPTGPVVYSGRLIEE